MPDRTNDEWLADLTSEGESYVDAVETLRARLQRSLYFYLSSERSDLSDRPGEEIQQMAQDFVQDSLLKILDKLHTFRGESKFTTWASKIAARVAISELRRARYKDYSLDHLTADGEIMPTMAASSSVSPKREVSPERHTEQESVLAVITNAIDTILTERQRIALTAIALEGKPLEEVAEQLNTNRNALYKLLHDARLKLKKHMVEQDLSLDYVMQLFERG